MPKVKTHSGASKRFKRTGSGKFVRRKSGRRHLLTSKARDRKRRLKGAVVVQDNATYMIERQLPYQA